MGLHSFKATGAGNHQTNHMSKIPMLKPRINVAAQQRVRILDAKAGTTVRPVGSSWMRLRKAVLLKHRYTCAQCGCISMLHEVDHIVPLEQGGHAGSLDDMSNLQALCTRRSGRGCHEDKTAREQRARFGGRGGIKSLA